MSMAVVKSTRSPPIGESFDPGRSMTLSVDYTENHIGMVRRTVCLISALYMLHRRIRYHLIIVWH
jgi:hypothetical protein